MTDWVSYKDAHPELFDIDRALEALTNSLPDLKERWEKYIREEYKDYSRERLDYIDITEIAQFILEKFKAGQTSDFDKFFYTLENILNKCLDDTENLMVVGFIEGLQNICGWEKIDYHNAFDKWLQPTTKKNWDLVIHWWENDDAKQK